ncbi:MAG TPA: hypothetical protein VI757_06865 [Bacteroidia bacterium]|nr:hypothetical protein [Bacteroidia bacterium]
MKERIPVMDERIISFLHAHTNLTIAVSENNIPYCANCFYAYSEKENLLIFKSKLETNHIRIALNNYYVSGTIVPDSLDKTRIQGIQFTALFIQPAMKVLTLARKIYYKKYPFAVGISGNIWAIELRTIKFTDNRLGFGKRLEWKGSENNF